jgi:hypothetical protein
VTREAWGRKRTTGWPRTEGSIHKRSFWGPRAGGAGAAEGRLRMGLLQGQKVGGIVDDGYEGSGENDEEDNEDNEDNENNENNEEG